MRRGLGAIPTACAVLAAGSCAAPAKAPPPPESPPLHLEPLADLAPAAGLRWILDARPRELMADPALVTPLRALVSDADLDAMAKAWGGVDVREADQMVVAGYDGSTLLLAHQVVDPGRVEAAFGSGVALVLGRAIDESGHDPRRALVRTWGATGAKRETLVIFGLEAVGFAMDGDVPLRAAELLALGRLRRSLPAWKSAPLDVLAARLGDAPIRVAAPGPFVGEWATGAGGLIGAASAVGASATVEGGVAHVVLVIDGPWGARSAEAKERVATLYGAVEGSGMGRLLGLRDPVTPAVLSATEDAVVVDLHLRATVLLQGLADAVIADLPGIMAHVAPSHARAPVEPR